MGIYLLKISQQLPLILMVKFGLVLMQDSPYYITQILRSMLHLEIMMPKELKFNLKEMLSMFWVLPTSQTLK